MPRGTQVLLASEVRSLGKTNEEKFSNWIKGDFPDILSNAIIYWNVISYELHVQVAVETYQVQQGWGLVLRYSETIEQLVIYH